MKKSIRFVALFVLLIGLLAASSASVWAAGNLDEIQRYDITIDMRPDGTADMTYHIEWKVLDSTSEGPLEWVKIGIANEYADEFQPLTANISNMSYYSDGGEYVRIDLDRSYFAGEIVTFEFSLHQANIYTIDNNDQVWRYRFVPGWFDGIEVKAMTIRWASVDTIQSNAASNDGDYLLWSQSLAAGETCQANVTYPMGVFTAGILETQPSNDDVKYTDYTYFDNGNSSDNGYTGNLFSGISSALCPLLGVGGIAGLIALVSKTAGGGGTGGTGGYRGGFFGGGGFRSGGGGGISSCASSCACVSSCACACACAGGGRAGCSAKELYGAKVQTAKLKEVIEKSK